MNYKRYIRIYAIALPLILTFDSALANKRATQPTPGRKMDSTSLVQSLFKSTQVVCFGRFIMDIPRSAIIVYGPAEVEAPIEYFPGQADKLAEHLRNRMKAIEEEREILRKDDFQRLPLFGKIIDGQVPGQKIAVGSKDSVSYTMHSFFTKKDDLFVQKINIVSPDTDRIATFNRVASNLRLRPQGEVPAEAGSCIEGAFIPLEQKYERVTIGLRFNEFPDVRFSIDAHKNQQWLAETGALELMRKQAKESAEQAGLGAVFARIKVFRHQARQLGAWKGVEILTRTPAFKDNTEAHEFRYESLGAVDDSLQPRLDVRLDSGVVKNSKASINPGITDEDALALWDRLISTIRVRQPSDATKPAGTSGKTSMFTTIPTGTVCPQTGWWQCTSLTDIEGTGRQLVNAGEPMPYAVELGKPGWLQKIMGVRPRYRLATTWRLLNETTLAGMGSVLTNDLIAQATDVAASPAHGDNITGHTGPDQSHHIS